MSDQNAQIVKTLMDRISSGDLDGVEELLADDFRYHVPLEPKPRDRDGFLQMVRQLRAAFPDWSLDVQEVVASGDLVAVRDVHSGTFEGEPFLGLEPTGERHEGPEHAFFRVQDGRIREGHTVFHTAGMLDALGAIELPPMGPPQ